MQISFVTKSNLTRVKDTTLCLAYSTGFLYYHILPTVYLLNTNADSNPFLGFLAQYSTNLHEICNAYIIWSIVYVIVFVTVAYLSSKSVLLRSMNFSGNPPRTAAIKLFILFISCLSILYVNPHWFLSPPGYIEDEGSSVIRGTLSSLASFNCWLFIYLRITRAPISALYKRFNLFTFVYCSIALLCLGSRLVVLSTIIAITSYQSIHYLRAFAGLLLSLRFKLHSLIIPPCILMSVLLFVYVLVYIGFARREGSLDTALLLFQYLPAESLAVFASFLSFIQEPVPYFQFPYDYTLGALVSMVPGMIFPGKSEFLSILRSINSDAQFSGLGGSNHLVVMFSNFGFSGLFIMPVIEGAWLGILYKLSQQSRLLDTAFRFSLGFVPFFFFRESAPQIVKVFVINAVILPFLLLKLFQSISRLLANSSASCHTNFPTSG